MSIVASVCNAGSAVCRIIVIAKAPIAGFCKTRLSSALGAEGAAQLAKRMLMHTITEAFASGVGPVELCAAPSSQDPAWLGVPLPAALQWSNQGSGDLGERMARAVARAFVRGERVLLVGTDCPALDAAKMRQAAIGLNDRAAVLMPANDGGYVLLGLTQPADDVFADMPWSTASVAEITLNRLAQLGLSVCVLPALQDIDEPGDLQWLPAAFHQPHNTDAT